MFEKWYFFHLTFHTGLKLPFKKYDSEDDLYNLCLLSKKFSLILLLFRVLNKDNIHKSDWYLVSFYGYF